MPNLGFKRFKKREACDVNGAKLKGYSTLFFVCKLGVRQVHSFAGWKFARGSDQGKKKRFGLILLKVWLNLKTLWICTGRLVGKL